MIHHCETRALFEILQFFDENSENEYEKVAISV